MGDEPALPQSTDGNFVLYVSSQANAVDPVDIKISIDGKVAVHQDFYARGGHNWIRFEFRLYPGKHTMNAFSVKGGASAENVFSVGEKLWCVVDFWDANPTHFTMSFSTYPPGFM